MMLNFCSNGTKCSSNSLKRKALSRGATRSRVREEERRAMHSKRCGAGRMHASCLNVSSLVLLSYRQTRAPPGL